MRTTDWSSKIGELAAKTVPKPRIFMWSREFVGCAGGAAPSGRHSLARAAGAPRAGSAAHGAAPSGRHSTLPPYLSHPAPTTLLEYA